MLWLFIVLFIVICILFAYAIKTAIDEEELYGELMGMKKSDQRKTKEKANRDNNGIPEYYDEEFYQNDFNLENLSTEFSDEIIEDNLDEFYGEL